MKITFTEGKNPTTIILDNLNKFSIKEIIHKVAEHQRENLSKGRSYDGSAIAPLKHSTIYAKIHKGSPFPFRVFYDSGFLVENGVVEKMLSQFSGEVSIHPQRESIMKRLMEGKRPLAGKRKGFGVGERLKKELREMIIKQIMRNAA